MRYGKFGDWGAEEGNFIFIYKLNIETGKITQEREQVPDMKAKFRSLGRRLKGIT